jgi:hypothetical protein
MKPVDPKTCLVQVAKGSINPQHNTVLVYRRRLRDLFAKTYWDVCISCNKYVLADRQPKGVERWRW